MKVLVDSCAWSLALRRKNERLLRDDERRIVTILVEAIKDSRAVLVGPVRQEVLSGMRHVEQFENLRERLEGFRDAAIDTADYVQAARLDNRCRAAGVQCGEVDMLLCAVAFRNAWTILTNDTGLVRCIEVVQREVIETDPKRRGQRLLELV